MYESGRVTTISVTLGLRVEFSERTRLAARVRATPEVPGPWLEFLQHETTQTTSPAVRGGVTLFRLYEWATKTIPRSGNSKNEEYLRVWLGYALEQGCELI